YAFPHSFSAIVFKLFVGLISLLGRENVRAGANEVTSRSARSRNIADGQCELWSRIENARTAYRVRDSVTKLQVPEAETMCPVSVCDIHAAAEGRCVIYVGEFLICTWNEGSGIQVLLITELEERPDIVSEVVV